MASKRSGRKAPRRREGKRPKQVEGKRGRFVEDPLFGRIPMIPATLTLENVPEGSIVVIDGDYRLQKDMGIAVLKPYPTGEADSERR